MKDPIGCLLLHGYGGSPYEMQGLKEVLRQEGYRVSVPLLPGHGQDLQALQRTGFPDWQAAAALAYEELAASSKQTYVLGLSMGGSLALGLAQHFQPAGVVVIAAPVFLYRFFPPQSPDWRLPLVPWLRFIRSIWPARSESDQVREIAPWQGYEGGQALHALTSLLRGLRRIRSGLAQITCPVLVLHALKDKTVPVDNAWEVIRRTSSSYRELRIFSILETVTSHHVLTTHCETRDQIAEAVLGFLSRDKSSQTGKIQYYD